jgi:hypothetical protein
VKHVFMTKLCRDYFWQPGAIVQNSLKDPIQYKICGPCVITLLDWTPCI